MNRLFIAAELGIPVVERLTQIQNELGRRFEATQLRMPETKDLHLTLKFLGETDVALQERIQETLHAFALGLFPFELALKGVGSFPDAAAPRIVWAGLEPKSDELVGLLKDTLERELENIGIPKETRDFKAHITLARVRDLTETPNMDDLKGLDVGSTYIRDLVLFSSTLTPNGAIYSVVDRFPLGPQ